MIDHSTPGLSQPTLDFLAEYKRIARRSQPVLVSPPPPLMGHIQVTYEDGSTARFPVRTEKKIAGMDFICQYHSAPWDYDDPDGDGVFNKHVGDVQAHLPRLRAGGTVSFSARTPITNLGEA